MRMTGNTIFITGGGSGIGRGLAEAFHRLGNQVIISGRRQARLRETLEANPGMAAIELDISDPASIQAASAQLLRDYPDLNVLINNAGIMLLDHAEGPVDDEIALSTVTTNLLGPVRMTSALIEHLKAQKDAVIVNVSSVLGFVPMAATAVYSATKAAVHSYTLSQRYLLREHGVQLVELAPPWVRTELLNSTEEERAIPLEQFISEAMKQFEQGLDEILVSPAEAMRANPGPNEHAWVNQFNDMVAAGPALG
ncbi:SDR family oxidoreductase [Pseudomonas sp. SCB32]|uniref:SDR family oxidoreductase n=1 Tax=Pseudomonas sp. SCB32 TaxID=2653853 RepID=UPI0012655207|nr:SDR family NAD(P)-dependent oxidoreductase [Pseudomonas sp. SCB32]